MFIEFAFDVPATTGVVRVRRCKVYVSQLDNDLNTSFLEVLAQVEWFDCAIALAGI